MTKKAMVLVLACIVAVVLLILGAAILARSVSENYLAQRNLEITQAFWLAEAGINRAVKELRADFSTSAATAKWGGSLANVGGEYSVDLGSLSGSSRTVTAYGFIPTLASPRITRRLQVTISMPTPTNFYDYAVYSAINISGGSSANSTVIGDVIFGGSNSYPTGKITGTATQDTSVNPLALLDFAQLRQISRDQNNYHDATHDPAYPTSFWYAEGVPNVVFVEGNFDLRGNRTRGGFIIVGGDVSYDARIAGNSYINGCIYERGNFTISGGGDPKQYNINGGLWAGGSADLGANAQISYNTEYMNAIRDMNINTAAQITSWKDLQNIYPLN